MKGIMENNGDAGTILRTNEQLDPEQREQLLAALRERKRRAGTADRPVFLWGGAEVITPKLSSSDLGESEIFPRRDLRGVRCSGRNHYLDQQRQVRRDGWRSPQL